MGGWIRAYMYGVTQPARGGEFCLNFHDCDSTSMPRTTALMLLLACAAGALLPPAALHQRRRTASSSSHSNIKRVSSRASCVRACAEDSTLYASLAKRREELTARSGATARERELVSELGSAWPGHERAQTALWQHWYGEEGEDARASLVEAEGKAEALLELMDSFPDWAEPANRLATLRYMEGAFAESVQLCLRVLRAKPWHFGASSGIVMCYAKLGNVPEANQWASEAMPLPGPKREQWVQRMLEKMDAKLEELTDL